MKSCYRRLIRLALLTNLVAGSLSIFTKAAIADPNTLQAKAQTELDAVTIDIDKANIMFSPADDDTGASFAKVVQYQQEYEAGRKSFNEGSYADALTHLRKADKLIRSQPDWTESE